MKFLKDKILKETNLVCAFARAEKIINSEKSSYDDLMQARAFLMEIFGKLETVVERLDKNDDSFVHSKLLQTIVHYMHGSLAWIIDDSVQAENEFKAKYFSASLFCLF